MCILTALNVVHKLGVEDLVFLLGALVDPAHDLKLLVVEVVLSHLA